MSRPNGGIEAKGSGSGVLSRALSGRDKGTPASAAMDEDFLGEYPVLHTFLTAVKGDDGSPRNTSVLTMFVEDGIWKGVLHERHASLCLWSSGDSWRKVLQHMEERLASGAAEWRKDRPQARR